MSLAKLALNVQLGLSLVACTQGGGTQVSLPEKPIASAPAASEPPPSPAPAAASEAPAPLPTAVQAETPPQSQPPALDEVKAKSDNAAMSTRFSGEVSSQRRSNLGFRVPGFIQEIRLRPGNTCRKGEVLAVLDPRDFKLNADEARSQRNLASVSLENSKGEFEREEQLRKENASTVASFDKVKTNFQKAKIDYELADLKLRRSDQALADTKLLAPYDCVVSKQQKYVGENVQPGSVVYEIYDTTDVELSFSVPERLAGQLKVGDKLQVTIPATAFKGWVDIIRLVPVVEESSRTFKVVAKAPQDQRVIPGLYAEASLR